MLTSKEQKRAAEEISNSSNNIGKGTFLEGNIETYGNIRIEGKVTGNIKSKSKVALGNSSQVQGNIMAQNADIEGEVKGRVEITELLVLKKNTVVNSLNSAPIATDRYIHQKVKRFGKGPVRIIEIDRP
jgi:cytoskeletal protein CcmA (bactofilin family)